MTDPVTPPPRKNPQQRTRTPTLPPQSRSRAATGLTAAAAEGRLMLQRCAACDAWQYPPRDVCHQCLGPALQWKDIPPQGRLLADTTLHTSTDVYFRERAPWRTGTVQLNEGPVIICHVHGDCETDSAVVLHNRLDRSGQGVLIAMPMDKTPNLVDDLQWRELTNTPRHRRILITDSRSPTTPALIQALLDAGASHLYVGEAEPWLHYAQQSSLHAMDHVDVLPLNVTDTESVQKLAGEIGGKTDILINNAGLVRAGGVLQRSDTTFAQDEINVNYLGLMRLAQAFGPAMCARAADGVNNAVAWVNLLSVSAFTNTPDYGSHAASQAAAQSLTQNMRTEFASSGVRVVAHYTGPTDDEWYQPLPPPKVTHHALARSVVNALEQGFEDVFCGDVANYVIEQYRNGDKVLEKELSLGH